MEVDFIKIKLRKIVVFASTAALCCFCSIATRAGDQSELPETVRREGIHWPGEGGKQIDVSIGIVLIDFARINLREESFEMAGYLDTSWTDTGLVLSPIDKRGLVRRFRPGQIWTPALEFVNAVEEVNTEREGDLYVTDDGRVSQRIRFSHKFQSSLELNRFPFDTQTLSIVISPFDPVAKDLRLVQDQRAGDKLSSASVTDWEINTVTARIATEKLGELIETRFVFDVKVTRRATFYIWRVIVPMTLLVIASWVVYWFEPTGLQPQISTGLAILLSLVTFTYAVDFSLPKVAYLTFIDLYVLTSFAFVLANIFSVTFIHVVLKSTDVKKALKLQRTIRILLPLAYGLTLASIAGILFF